MMNIFNKNFDFSKAKFIKNFNKNLFSWKELNLLLNLRPFLSTKRVSVLDIPEGGYNWPNQSWLSDVNTFPPELFDSIIRTKTCLIIDCSRVNQKINNLCQFLEIITKKPTDAHIYFTLNEKSKSFPPHIDENNNLIVQVEGISNLKIWKNDTKLKPDIDIILKKGDAMYIPKNIYHQIISLTKRLSISFPMSEANLIRFQERHWINV